VTGLARHARIAPSRQNQFSTSCWPDFTFMNIPCYRGIASSVSMRLLSQTTMRSRKRKVPASSTRVSR
jgi:hypothetical protein